MAAQFGLHLSPNRDDAYMLCNNDTLSQHGYFHLCKESALDDVTTVAYEDSVRSQGYQSFLAYMEHMENIPVEAVKSITVAFYSIGVLANLLLLVYIVKFKRYRSPTFAAIFSLAIADAGSCFGAAMFSVFAMYRLIGPPWMCIFCMFITVVPYTTSIWHMVGFSVMRFCQLVFPLQARAKITISLITKIAIVIWLLNTVALSFNRSFYKAHTYPYKGDDVSICAWEENIYQLFIETIYLLVPNFLVAGFHVIKHFMVKRQSQKALSEGISDDDKQRQSTDGRAVMIIVVVYCFTSWPQLLHFYLHFVFRLPPASFHELLGVICITMEYGNSIFNPFIYVFCASSIRRDVIKMLRCDK